MDAVLKIRQMCDLFQVTARTLRFYEDKELIKTHSRRPKTALYQA